VKVKIPVIAFAFHFSFSLLLGSSIKTVLAQTRSLPKASFPATDTNSLPTSYGMHLTTGLDRTPQTQATRYDPGEPALKGALVRWQEQKMPLLIWLGPGLQLPDCPVNEIQSTRVDYVTSLLQQTGNPFNDLKQAPSWTAETNDLVAAGIEQWREFENEGLIRFAFTDDPRNANICVFFCGGFKDASQPGGINIGGITSAQVYPLRQAEAIKIKQKPVIIELSTLVNSTPERMIGAASHEFGHALGIKAHSPYRDDIMYVDRVVNQLSQGDRATIRWLYHQIPQYVM
jgi:hypothetical protein